MEVHNLVGKTSGYGREGMSAAATSTGEKIKLEFLI